MKHRIFYFLLLIIFCSCQRINYIRVNDIHEDGSLSSVSYYVKKDNKKSLVKKCLFYANGQLKMEGHFKRKVKHGYWAFYFEDGQKADMAWYIKGELNGRTMSWYKNGQTRYAGYYKDGKRIRNWVFFDEEGELMKKIKYSR
jgi:antitoxin component YwqK of YwqJK toxin-antitoxin module